jgi:hypothetical protein
MMKVSIFLLELTMGLKNKNRKKNVFSGLKIKFFMNHLFIGGGWGWKGTK